MTAPRGSMEWMHDPAVALAVRALDALEKYDAGWTDAAMFILERARPDIRKILGVDTIAEFHRIRQGDA